MRRWMKKHWKLSCLLILFLFGGCSWGMLEYTHQPRFCLSCHVMEPYYEAWETSSHSMVGCVDCHYQPGLRYEVQGKLDALNQIVAYWTGSYNTKFYAEIADESCMRSGCHDTGPLEGPLEFKRGIKFDHQGHYGREQRGINLRCTSCHSQIVQGNHMAVTEFTCFLCHFRGQTDPSMQLEQEFCTNCHNYPKSIVDASGIKYNHADYVERGVICWRCHSDVIQGDGHVEDRACLQCHDNYNQITLADNTHDIHLNHVTNHKVECFNCHANIDHSVPNDGTPETAHRMASFSCGNCHFDTHVGPRELYAGTGGRGVADNPSKMYLAQVDCTGCHLDAHALEHTGRKELGVVRKSGVDACEDCHPDMGAQVYEYWTESLSAQLKETRAALEAAQAAVDGREEVDAATLQALEDGWFNFYYVDRSQGVHNLPYSLELLEYAREQAQSVME